MHHVELVKGPVSIYYAAQDAEGLTHCHCREHGTGPLDALNDCEECEQEGGLTCQIAEGITERWGLVWGEQADKEYRRELHSAYWLMEHNHGGVAPPFAGGETHSHYHEYWIG